MWAFASGLYWQKPCHRETRPPGPTALDYYLRPAELKSYYNTVIDQKIRNRRAKMTYRDSKFNAMRDVAIRSAVETNFLESNHDALLAEMLESGLGTNRAKVEHFLNQRLQTHLDALNRYYLSFIDKKTSNCKAKVGYGQSKLDSMRRTAVLSALKVQFLETNRDDLAAHMIETEAGTRTTKLERLVNERFHGFIHPRLMTYLASP